MAETTASPDTAIPPATGAIPARHEVPVEMTWDVASVFPDDAAWEAAFVAAEGRLAEMAALRGRLATSGEALLAALALRDDLYQAIDRVYTYADLRFSEDAGNRRYAAAADRAGGLRSRFAAAVAWVDTELLDVPAEGFAAWVEGTPGLAAYRHAVRRVHDARDHILPAETEELLARVSDALNTARLVHTNLEDNDLPFGTITDEAGETVPLAQGNVERYLASRDARVRRETWDVAADAYLAFADTFAAAYAGSVKRDVFYATTRGYGSALEAALAPNQIPVEVFHNLVDTVRANFPTWQRYFRVRRRFLGVETLTPGDLAAPLATDPPHVPFAAGVEMVLASLAPMGEAYVEINRRGVADRWVDALPNRGKGGGAFSNGTKGTHPFISMNHHDDIGSVSTLAHELGHSLHTYHATRARPMAYWPYSMFAAETASNLHQALMGRYLLGRDAGWDWEVSVLEERMANFLRYLFIMPILARFELDCHGRVERGEALTAGEMGETLAGFYAEGYGDAVRFDTDRTGITWARFSHLYTPFYVFQYGTGIAAASALAERILDEGEPALARYIAFLEAGGDGYPIELLDEAGIDMRSPEPIERAFALMASYVDRLEALASERG
ncbi:MAG: oligoendopeptidase F, partial [Thermomicrobiales bacterium]